MSFNLLEANKSNSIPISIMTTSINEAFQISHPSVGSRNIAVHFHIIPMSPETTTITCVYRQHKNHRWSREVLPRMKIKQRILHRSGINQYPPRPHRLPTFRQKYFRASGIGLRSSSTTYNLNLSTFFLHFLLGLYSIACRYGYEKNSISVPGSIESECLPPSTPLSSQ